MDLSQPNRSNRVNPKWIRLRMLSPWLCMKTPSDDVVSFFAIIENYSHYYTTHLWQNRIERAQTPPPPHKKEKTCNNNRKFTFSNGGLCDLKRVICVVVVLVCFYGHVASFDNIFCQLPAETMYDG